VVPPVTMVLTVPGTSAVVCRSEPPLSIISPLLPALFVMVPFTVSAFPASIVTLPFKPIVKLLQIAGDAIVEVT